MPSPEAHVQVEDQTQGGAATGSINPLADWENASPADLVVREVPLIVIFGATGDLASRKLFPALFRVWQDRYIPTQSVILAVGRRPLDDAGFNTEIRDALGKLKGVDAASIDEFLQSVFYQQVDFGDQPTYDKLKERIRTFQRDRMMSGNILFYLATPPTQFALIVQNLAAVKLLDHTMKTPWARVIVEKPFGHDLASATELNQSLRQHVREDQLYRIDHYLGKETVQNVLMFRFGNAIFEPVFHRHYVDHVQITMAEDLGMEGRRGAFYDQTGALRDVVQNHLLQLLALVAMEPPSAFRAREIRDEKVKLLRSIHPFSAADVRANVVRGQYVAGQMGTLSVAGYHQETGVAADSLTETFVAAKMTIESWRWAGVPFYLRAGKGLAKRVTEIAIHFRFPPLRSFQQEVCNEDICVLSRANANVLCFRIQPDEGIHLTFSAKRPGASKELQPVRMDFYYAENFSGALPDAYERLLLDALLGDATLFTRSDEVAAQWELVDPILNEWKSDRSIPLHRYAFGSWGPSEADNLLANCHPSAWRQP